MAKKEALQGTTAAFTILVLIIFIVMFIGALAGLLGKTGLHDTLTNDKFVLVASIVGFVCTIISTSVASAI